MGGERNRREPMTREQRIGYARRLAAEKADDLAQAKRASVWDRFTAGRTTLVLPSPHRRLHPTRQPARIRIRGRHRPDAATR